MSQIEQIIVLDDTIGNIDIKDQYVSLNAPITLSGQLNITKLIADKTFSSMSSPLQIGVDEAGRGPLLGCVTIAAAILPNTWSDLIEHQPLQNTPLCTLTDSKKLSEKKRDILYPLVQKYALGFVVAEIPAAVIDQINILAATMLGMRLCSETLLKAIAQHFATIVVGGQNELNKGQIEILIDGNRCPDLDYLILEKLGLPPSAIDCQAWIKGDARHTSIAAASILAKVSRDRTMYEMDAKYPNYAIAQHKGYPTRAHIAAIDTYGVLPEHRRSFAPIKHVQ
nr:ribonuclease HII [uncultured Psychrobacter sp.]